MTDPLTVMTLLVPLPRAGPSNTPAHRGRHIPHVAPTTPSSAHTRQGLPAHLRIGFSVLRGLQASPVYDSNTYLGKPEPNR